MKKETIVNNYYHLFLRAEIKKFPLKGTSEEDLIVQKVKNLISAIGMKCYIEPVAKYMTEPSNLGMTFIAGIETSHLTGHWFECSGIVQIDLFTCGQLEQKQINELLLWIKEYEPTEIDLQVFDRRNRELQQLADLSYDAGVYDSSLLETEE
jgi:S-adenosylmethionine/arginine decarboxylase-like enzyme